MDNQKTIDEVKEKILKHGGQISKTRPVKGKSTILDSKSGWNSGISMKLTLK